MPKNLNQIVHHISTISTYIIFIVSQIGLALEFALHQSFAHSHILGAPEHHLINGVRYFEREDDCSSVECCVCLSEIEEGDETREISCDHLFHRECLDRWIGYGNITCPLCRNCVRMPSRTQLFPEFHQELFLYNNVYANRSSLPFDNNIVFWAH
ncbi:hypothetical protein Leryth_002169 [Lithospermum erythrorhizon]|nr:hypothetical protein Leryth_002169 [Lithospermum erythrorhizon]